MNYLAFRYFKAIVLCAGCTCLLDPYAAGAQENAAEDSAATSFAADDPELKPMFKSDSFDGWVQLNGRSKYEIKDGIITGTCVAGEPNSFLATGMDYSNFVLELEFKIGPQLNSGVQIRSQCFANATSFTDASEKKYKIPPGRVHGYQVEIDPSSRKWTGGIYDEARRAWLDDLEDTPAAKEAFDPVGWNHFRIECNGDHIQTWINGVAAADLTDNATPAGFIALQVHGAGNNQAMIGSSVQWRNIRIKLLD